jgi:hypothetical protein
MPGQVAAMDKSNRADDPGKTRSSRAVTAETLPTRCLGKVAAIGLRLVAVVMLVAKTRAAKHQTRIPLVYFVAAMQRDPSFRNPILYACGCWKLRWTSGLFYVLICRQKKTKQLRQHTSTTRRVLPQHNTKKVFMKGCGVVVRCV